MSISITTLPTLANTRPELTRPRVPEELLTKLSPRKDEAEQTEKRDEPKPYLDTKGQSKQGPNSPVSLAGASVVALQAREFVPETPAPKNASVGPKELSDEEKAQVQELKARDQEVRAHENAHKNVGGGYTGAVEYEYTVGPDDQRYAIGGKVSIDTSPVAGDPEATLDKMRVVQSAALAPASPSGADRAVAARAAQISRDAESALREKRAEEKEAETAESQPSVSQATETIETIETPQNPYDYSTSPLAGYTEQTQSSGQSQSSGLGQQPPLLEALDILA